LQNKGFKISNTIIKSMQRGNIWWTSESFAPIANIRVTKFSCKKTRLNCGRCRAFSAPIQFG